MERLYTKFPSSIDVIDFLEEEHDHPTGPVDDMVIDLITTLAPHIVREVSYVSEDRNLSDPGFDRLRRLTRSTLEAALPAGCADARQRCYRHWQSSRIRPCLTSS
jgi:hypothetical protein